VKSVTTARFRKLFTNLPAEVRDQARSAYRLWQGNPHHRSLAFKRIDPVDPIYSVRIGLHWRAIATVAGDTAIWYWIGSHSDYDKFIGS
jgi:hypothetical protein